MTPSLQRLSRWQKLALLALLTIVLGAILLNQEVQSKQTDMATSRTQRAKIDPVRTLVTLQGHLQAHRGLAAMVLTGNSRVDAERRARRTDVVGHLGLAERQLRALGQTRATQSALALRTGWEQLSLKIDSRSIGADESFEAHGVLMEQNIALIELVAQAAGVPPSATATPSRPWSAIDHLQQGLDDRIATAGRQHQRLTVSLLALGCLALGLSLVLVRSWPRARHDGKDAATDDRPGRSEQPPREEAADLLGRLVAAAPPARLHEPQQERSGPQRGDAAQPSTTGPESINAPR